MFPLVSSLSLIRSLSDSDRTGDQSPGIVRGWGEERKSFVYTVVAVHVHINKLEEWVAVVMPTSTFDIAFPIRVWIPLEIKIVTENKKRILKRPENYFRAPFKD